MAFCENRRWITGDDAIRIYRYDAVVSQDVVLIFSHRYDLVSGTSQINKTLTSLTSLTLLTLFILFTSLPALYFDIKKVKIARIHIQIAQIGLWGGCRATRIIELNPDLCFCVY